MRFGVWAERYRSAAEPVVAAFCGLVVFPVIFTALSTHDVRLGGRTSLVNLVWLILALTACFFIVRARGMLGRAAVTAAGRLVASLPGASAVGGTIPTTSSEAKEAGDAQGQAGAIAQGLLDLILLLVIQACLRSPLVGVLDGTVAVAWADGAYVIVVVVLAIGILINLYRVGRPLAERLTWVGLNQFVPTAGFAAGSVTATFTARLATTTARSTSATSSKPRESASVPAQTIAAADTPTLAGAPTIAAESLEATRPALAESTVLAPTAEPVPPEATVFAPPASAVSETGATETTVAVPGESTETIAVNPVLANEPQAKGGKDEER